MSSKEILKTARKNTTFFMWRPRTDFGGFDPVRPPVLVVFGIFHGAEGISLVNGAFVARMVAGRAN